MRPYQNGCGCGYHTNGSPHTAMQTPVVNRVRRIIDNEYPIGMAYVPWQQWNEVFDAETALCRGTLFPELELPFTGCERRNCRG